MPELHKTHTNILVESMPVLLFTYVSKYPDKMSLTSNKQEKLFKKNVENLIFSHFYANWRNPVQKGEVKNGFYSSKIPYPNAW